LIFLSFFLHFLSDSQLPTKLTILQQLQPRDICRRDGSMRGMP
jgi:hypothetical protein